MLRKLVHTGVLVFSVVLIALAEPNPSANGYVGNEACARCHASLYNSYSRTYMARASGPATDNLIAGEFFHKRSGVHYRIYEESGKVWLAFERPEDAAVRGRRELLYYIGSGRRGRSYLFAVNGYVFESPVNWYANKQLWDMAPAYEDARQIPMNLPALTSCLDCHVSGMRPPIEGSENRYREPLMSASGVTCERCHGPGAAHVKGGAIVNPAKLAPSRRDAVCMQCHLEGNVAIERADRHLYDFRPGDDLSDYIRYYLLTEGAKGVATMALDGGGRASAVPELRAASQFEALAESACKKKSGDAMSCTSCHDPHRSPTAAERVAFYRDKCLACHGTAFGARHHTEQKDCTLCHMPAAESRDVAHTQVTDHRVPRYAISSASLQDFESRTPSLPKLVPFPPAKGARDDTRELALAWDSIAQGGMTMAEPEAERRIREALKQQPKDPALLSAMGYIQLKHGATAQAREYYQQALAADPNLVDAAMNLGVVEARSGNLGDAVKLWQGAFRRAPGRSSIGMNLVRAFCTSGQYDEARNYTLRVLEFNPDDPAAKKLLNRLNSTPVECRP